jgi:hypothetical protein
MPLDQLATLLQEQSTRTLDVIAGSGAIRSVGGNLVLDNTAPQLGPDGVTMTEGTYAINDIAQTGIADKLGIPVAYLRKMAAEFPELYDDNVNGWLARTDRRFLIRALRTASPTQTTPYGPGLEGTVRAFLSDRYLRLDNLDLLMAALEGVQTAGANIQIDGCDLTDRRMYVRVYSPDVQAIAPELLRNYKSPFDGRPGSDLPVVWGGFIIRNSETGSGAFNISPRLMVQVCKNGMIMENTGFRRTHLGAQHNGAEGVVTASTETLDKTLELVTAQTRDAVKSYLDPDYVARMIRDLEAVSGKPIENPDTTIKLVSTRLRFSDEQQNSILSHFIKGADLSAGGIMHAVTSVAQTLTDADAAHDMETVAVQAMHLAAAAN